MSYQLTTIAQYGVRLAGDEARIVFADISERQYLAELEVESEDIYEGWKRSYVGSWLDIEEEHDRSEPIAFYLKYEFCQRLVPRSRQEIIVDSSYPDKPLSRARYHSDFRHGDALRRGNRLYDAEVERHFFGIYLASYGYAYLDDLDAFSRPVPRIALDNYADFCAPALARLGLAREPRLYVFEQIW